MSTTHLTSQAQRKKVHDYMSIIQFTPNGTKYHNAQAARADPNQRLTTVFGIDNAFTTYDKNAASDFRRKATVLMNLATKSATLDARGNVKKGDYPSGDWSDLRAWAVEYCKEYKTRLPDRKRVKLAQMVQFVTLKVSLRYLFPEHALKRGDSFEDIVMIGRRINELWVASKEDEGQLPRWEDEGALNEALRRVTTPAPGVCRGWTGAPDHGIAQEPPEPTIPHRNPMNLILPAYETMWRVVMRCVLEMRYRNADRGPVWCGVLSTYLESLKDPNVIAEPHNSFQDASADGVRPIDIVKEALRLYPPTRRVHRVYDGERCAADIEECQRFPLLGGRDALVFRPERWQDICPEESVRRDREGSKAARTALKEAEEKAGFFPFAHWCPAGKGGTHGFGLKMVGLLVAVICAEIDESWEVDGYGELLDRNQPLSAERTAYEDLELMKP
ncbi:hypothetical protein P171DRAFT_497202 [Karstenula rhodostoma CBS 690.94]|uniref:Uncharacterized protein n=1 Tax=Karstenula rhodostoma CBS 690.94 TaxID=1392251 RepID=A0A9P4UAM4_9PLEO|nr:hypothetical protein P171DRAFT_497202 [Karstenula rhodostoma CBS 690.94]